jgi:hypothetical protein
VVVAVPRVMEKVKEYWLEWRTVEVMLEDVCFRSQMPPE